MNVSAIHSGIRAAAAAAVVFSATACAQEPPGPQHGVEDLIAAVQGDTPMIDDLQDLVDTVGGRVTGTPSNEAAVDWALARFAAAGVEARAEAFEMPRLWVENETRVTISGDVTFAPRAVAKHFSGVTGPGGLSGPLVDVGKGSAEELAAAGDAVEGAWVLVETDVVEDIGGLFAEYTQAAAVENALADRGVAGVAYVSSRPMGLLYRLPAARFFGNELPLVIVEREEGLRLRRLLAEGAALSLTATVDAESSDAFTARNVIGEIEGSDLKDEIVVIGAHLDSYGLGTGANDNAANVAMLIDIARQMTALEIKPRRTIRFALWNGEEQGLIGSWKYTMAHAEDMDDHLIAGSIDIGSGRITGFWMNGRGDEIQPRLEAALAPVAEAFGPFAYSDDAVLGTDNFDFLLHGVANLVAIHESYNYGPNYHAESDTYDKVDTVQLRKNAAIVAAAVLGLADDPEASFPQDSRAEVQALIDSTPLKAEMEDWNIMPSWIAGERGRAAE